MTEVRPFQEWVVKCVQPCNLACDHCYVYELRDTSWRSKPRFMVEETADRLAARIAEHARKHDLESVRIVLHGGEPLLAGRRRIEHLLSVLQSELRGIARCDISLQSNGTLLDPRWLELFHRYGVSVGVSLDGDRDANDRHRRSKNGRSSHTAVQRGLELLKRPENRALYRGLLCTVDLANDPGSVYAALLAQEPKRVDFLLPHATWEYPPPGHDPRHTPYARWLIEIFERWYSAPRRETRIRLFDNIMDLSLGGEVRSSSVGLAASDVIVVESDGSVELPDSLKAAYEGAAATGMNVFDHDFDTVARFPAVVDARGEGPETLAEECQGCSVVRICGGGLRAHRFHPTTGFANPSVYSADLRVLTTHIRDRVVADVTAMLERAS
ncbi:MULTISPECIES: FxsB family cyclophane-forming radical SAM/SPASM peptide maturase [Streptomyces]|uniref:FxsB family radical SAM/SPASM domain protein n=1 Tax=Streptomyces griseoaurantiacus TaxID=68213 RepID=A0ABZ1UVC1_9ACTN|nr:MULTISPECIES: FxsB family cyclophane-forming radical SAM/SPASM peptide maturase [Streptomyces]MCF0089745.1 Anaerobic sulfatase-maturating enzyme [Streptomyces sp. MH192]MCF0102094.1 Anaerobic sulfatase-maturating enzyme [Streptomyces sp. MH191]WTI30436.1 FxsB family radical SAM/SPASM domain protein [Streptomyces jietaisiensis]